MRQNILTLINNVLGQLFLIAVIGVLVLLWVERKNFWLLIRTRVGRKRVKFSWQLLDFLKRPVALIIWGYVLILLSFAIVNTVIEWFFTPGIVSAQPLQDLPVNANFGLFLKYQSQFSGMFTVIGLLISGICLILSGGTKWMVTLAKIFATLSFFYLFVSALALYA